MAKAIELPIVWRKLTPKGKKMAFVRCPMLNDEYVRDDRCMKCPNCRIALEEVVKCTFGILPLEPIKIHAI